MFTHPHTARLQLPVFRLLNHHTFSTVAESVNVNGKNYNLPLRGRPVVAICLDGSDPAYIDAAGPEVT